MRMAKYDKIVLMGSKTTAYKCAQIASQYAKVHFYENKVNIDRIPACYSEDPNITWHICANGEWKRLLLNETKKTLFISVVNQSILPKEIIEKKNITFINLHSGILPNYRGRNCCGWAIFNGESFTGATWHYLIEGVDEGKLLWEKKVVIGENDTSFKIFREQNMAGIELFQAHIEHFLSEEVDGFPQPQDEIVHFHLAREKPNNGYLDLTWSGEKMSCFLRATDYGPLKEFGIPRVEFKGKVLEIEKYTIEKIAQSESNIFFLEPNQLIIEKNEYKFTLKVKSEKNGKISKSIE